MTIPRLEGRIGFFPRPVYPPIRGITQYRGGIVHAVQGSPSGGTICGCDLSTGPHHDDPGLITCQDCLCTLAGNDGAQGANGRLL